MPSCTRTSHYRIDGRPFPQYFQSSLRKFQTTTTFLRPFSRLFSAMSKLQLDWKSTCDRRPWCILAPPGKADRMGYFELVKVHRSLRWITLEDWCLLCVKNLHFTWKKRKQKQQEIRWKRHMTKLGLTSGIPMSFRNDWLDAISSTGVSGSRGWEGFDIVREDYACAVDMTIVMCLLSRDPLQGEYLVCANGATRVFNSWCTHLLENVLIRRGWVGMFCFHMQVANLCSHHA